MDSIIPLLTGVPCINHFIKLCCYSIIFKHLNKGIVNSKDGHGMVEAITSLI